MPNIKFIICGNVFVFLINLDKDIINEYYIVNNDKKSNKIISLISFLLGGHQIKLQLIMYSILKEVKME